ncbi:MAG: SRPBCC domain-containing protein [Bacteroidetes bacterium]|nr:SRPBCC domain-containing protein [Bacteroidota bacterium]
MAQNGTATTTKTTFSRETTVSISIQAESSIIWSLLTNAADYPRWNSTIIAIDGTIAAGEKIELKSTLDTTRTFKLKVLTFQPESLLIWGDSQGQRTYTLSKNDSGTITFTMTEKIGCLMFPMYAKYLPSFDEAFEQFASDLKTEAEKIMKTK